MDNRAIADHFPKSRVCMLAYTFYETDGRVMRYAECLAAHGVVVEAIVLRRPGQPTRTRINGVDVFRIQEREKNETGKLTYLRRLLAFFFRSMFTVARRHLRSPYDIVHVHSIPDFEVFAALVPKLLGAKIILDIHDIVPEFYAAKFHVTHDSTVFTALKLVERLSVAFSDHVIVANDIWQQRIAHRCHASGKSSVFLNYPDPAIFHPRHRLARADSRFIAVYPGTLNWHQGLDIAVTAIGRAREAGAVIHLHIYGEGSARSSLEQLVHSLGLETQVLFRDPLPLREIARVMAAADLGIVPKRDDSFGGEAFSTKILEFMALGVPVLVSATRIDTHYFDGSLVSYFRPGDDEDLAQKLIAAYADREANAALARNALKYAERMSWANNSGRYLSLLKHMMESRRTSV